MLCYVLEMTMTIILIFCIITVDKCIFYITTFKNCFIYILYMYIYIQIHIITHAYIYENIFKITIKRNIILIKNYQRKIVCFFI